MRWWSRAVPFGALLSLAPWACGADTDDRPREMTSVSPPADGLLRYIHSAQEPFVGGVVHIDGSNTVTYVTETGSSSECPRR